MSADFYLGRLSDKNPNVRKKAAETLGKLGGKVALFRLKDALRTEQDDEVKAVIVEAIAKLEA